MYFGVSLTLPFALQGDNAGERCLLMRTSAALGKIQVNFSFALVGTNFATKEDLSFPRSVEPARLL